MIAELSVLIPVYNYDVTALVTELLEQCRNINCRFEICLYDDGSTEAFRLLHRPFNEAEEVRYVELKQNIGRSAIRNLLAREAKYNWLLFLDNDSKLPDSQFIKRYLENPETSEVIIGGTNYEPAPASEIFMLRWKYGKAREEKKASTRAKKPYQSITLNNIFLKKEVFLSCPLETNLPNNYGHEDTLFGLELKTKGTEIMHIDNPVIHMGLEPASDFLNKTEQAVGNLYQYFQSRHEMGDNKLIKSYLVLKQTGTAGIFLTCFKKLEPVILGNLKSRDPSLFYFDLYKLGLFVELASGRK